MIRFTVKQFPFPRFIILFDDKSSDRSVEIAQGYGATVLQSDQSRNLGPSYGRNRLLEVTRAEWIHFHDTDDLLEPTFLENLIAYANPKVDVVTCHTDWKDEYHGNVQLMRRYCQNDLDQNALTATLTNPIGVVSTVLRKRKIVDIGSFDESLTCWEDGDLYVRLAANGARFRVVDKLLAYSMRHGGGISAGQAHCAKCRLKLLQRYRESYPQLDSTVLGNEVEKVAAQLVKLRQFATCKEATAFAHALGTTLPQTKNPLLSIGKRFFPAHLIFILQQLLHQRKSHDQ